MDRKRLLALGAVLLALILAKILTNHTTAPDLVRVLVAGFVYFEDQPVARGQIRFVPLDDNRAPASGLEIRGGQFMTSDDLEKYGTIGAGGIPVGKYRVEIMALAGGF